MKLSKKFAIIALFAVMVQSVGFSYGLNYPELEVQLELVNNSDDYLGMVYQDHAVFSNRTNLHYEVYPEGTNLVYDAVDRFGNRIIEGATIILDAGGTWGVKHDYSLDIHPQGDKVYMVIGLQSGDSGLNTWKDNAYVYYMAINENTNALDVLSSDEIDTVWNNDERWFDIAVTGEGYQAVTYSYDGHHGAISTSDGLTNWNDAQKDFIDDLYISETGYNPANTNPHYVCISNYDTNGISFYWANRQDANNWWERQALFTLYNLTTWNLNGYQSANLDIQQGFTQWIYPAFGYTPTYDTFDIVGDYGGKMVYWINSRDAGANNEFYVRWYNGTSDTTGSKTIESTGTASTTWRGYLWDNARGSANLVWTNSTNIQNWNISKWNHTSGTFDDSIYFMTTKNSNTDTPITLDVWNEFQTGSNFVLDWTTEKANPATISYENSLEWGWFYLDNYTGYFPYDPILENQTIVGLEAGNWLFEGEIYVFSFDVNNQTEAGYIRFDDDDTTIQINFNETTNRVTVDLSEDEENKISIIDYSNINDHWNITFTLGEGIDDCLDVDIDYWVENFYHNVTLTGAYLHDLKIYNLGGFTFDRTVSNTGGFYSYGHPLEAWSQYNGSSSYVNTSQVYRKLQWWHSQFALDVSDNDVFDTLENTGDVEIHLQYLEDGVWQDVIYVSFDIVNGAVDPSGAGAGKAWVNIAWNWYGRNDAGNMASVRNGYFVAYPDCGDDVSSDATTLQLWADLWLDRANNSKAVGGNLSPYYYGMDETGWLLFNSWRPIMTNTTFGTVTIPLRNSTGSIIQADQMDLMRVSTWVITGSNLDTNPWAVRDFKNQDYLLAQGRLRGIDKPPLVETLVIDMPSSGFLSGLRKAINALGQTIINALAGAWKTSIGLIDTILEFLGLGEGIFSSLVYAVGEMLQLFEVIIANFGALVQYAVDNIISVITLVIAVAGKLVFMVVEFVEIILVFYNAVVQLFTGGWNNVGNLWNDLDILSWLQLFFVCIFPFYEYNRIAESDHPLETMKDDANTLWNILTAILRVTYFLWEIMQSIWSLIINIVRG